MEMSEGKKLECKMLQDLHGLNGYFTESFTKEDVEQMKKNIENDFDLLCGTSRDKSAEIRAYKERVHELDARVRQLETSIQIVENELKDCEAEKNSLADALKSAEKRIDELACELIKAHIRGGEELGEFERAWLLTALS